MICSAIKGPKAAQLTMFYGGQVIVFDDFPADRAHELMSFASKGISQSHNNSVFTYTQSQPSFPINLVRTSADSTTPIVPSVNIVANTGAGSVLEHPQVPSRPIVCGNFLKPLTLKFRMTHAHTHTYTYFKHMDYVVLIVNFLFCADLPIARKASLHRFLEKRKDR